MAKKSYAVIGLGQFGLSIVRELVANGADVIAIDIDEQSVKKATDILPTVFVADSTDEDALKELSIGDVDTAVVAYGNNKEASVLTTVILRELGIPKIIVRADDEFEKYLDANKYLVPPHLTKREKEYWGREIEINKERTKEVITFPVETMNFPDVCVYIYILNYAATIFTLQIILLIDIVSKPLIFTFFVPYSINIVLSYRSRYNISIIF